MNKCLMAGASLILATQISSVNADILALTGTASLYDPSGFDLTSGFGFPTVITGIYDTDTGQITIDPWFFFGQPVNSEIDVLDPGSYTIPGVLPIEVGPSQLGGSIISTWGPNTIPHGIVWDIISYPGGMHFEPVDSDGDGIPGIPMISGPFPGFTFVYEFDVGAPSPSIGVSLDVDGGSTQQCDEPGGNKVEAMATIDLSGGAELASIEWEVDGSPVGSGVSINPFLSLGNHTISVTATGVSGIYDTASTTVNVIDTVDPDLSIEFVDTRSGQVVSSVEGGGVSFIEVRLNGSDVCDADVNVSGVAKPVTAVMGGEVFKIKGNKQDVDMPINSIEVMATATDDSGNSTLGQAILPINP